jgi:hypothetical protein
MFQKFKEIINAWVIANNPREEERLLAEKRFSICDICPEKKVITDKIKIATICGKCGCPIAKKIFTTQFNACPLKKWESVDNIFYPKTQKTEKTLL